MKKVSILLFISIPIITNFAALFIAVPEIELWKMTNRAAIYALIYLPYLFYLIGITGMVFIIQNIKIPEWAIAVSCILSLLVWLMVSSATLIFHPAFLGRMFVWIQEKYIPAVDGGSFAFFALVFGFWISKPYKKSN